jgi:hypothetical protein
MRVQKSGLTEGKTRVCHVRVRDVARAAAAQLYEAVMQNNEACKVWREQNPGATAKQLEDRFVEKNWPKCIDFARQTLTLLLTRDDVAESTKDEIMDVLEKDQSLRGKVAATQLH